ncbi:MAG: S-methyl-5'-thioinosine phosphorylase [Thiotrichaceae bacterium]|nr:S-methyl-5'-thioinosine phosphorylase [Thiotrichaceae bacterium]
MSELVAIIGGTGLTALEGLEITHRKMMYTPYGEASSPITHGEYNGKPVVFLPRHGSRHTIPPHKINYRANIWSLKELGVKNIIAVAAVGGINMEMKPKDLVIPHQLVDYTWGRKHTFFEDGDVQHIDFTDPYTLELREKLLSAAKDLNFPVHDKGVYAATQGPRLETTAEIDRLEKEGCDLVGMTGMPEAALAREVEINYASCALVVNEAAGRGPEQITMAEIERNLEGGIQRVRELLAKVLTLI